MTRRRQGRSPLEVRHRDRHPASAAPPWTRRMRPATSRSRPSTGTRPTATPRVTEAAEGRLRRQGSGGGREGARDQARLLGGDHLQGPALPGQGPGRHEPARSARSTWSRPTRSRSRPWTCRSRSRPTSAAVPPEAAAGAGAARGGPAPPKAARSIRGAWTRARVTRHAPLVFSAHCASRSVAKRAV